MSTFSRPRVGLFATCLVDLYRPTIGFAAAKLIEAAGCDVDVPVADLLRPTRLQLRRQGHGQDAGASGDRGVRGLRLRGGAVRLVRRHAEERIIPSC